VRSESGSNSNSSSSNSSSSSSRSPPNRPGERASKQVRRGKLGTTGDDDGVMVVVVVVVGYFGVMHPHPRTTTTTTTTTNTELIYSSGSSGGRKGIAEQLQSLFISCHTQSEQARSLNGMEWAAGTQSTCLKGDLDNHQST